MIGGPTIGRESLVQGLFDAGCLSCGEFVEFTDDERFVVGGQFHEKVDLKGQ